MEQKLHTPEGVRDIYNRECETKLTIQNILNHALHLYGYQDIQTPTFEYYDVFREEIGSTSTRELYRFIDRDGNLLALRPDITPSVARAVATLFKTEDLPLRLCYSGNTFLNHSSYQGRLKENTQLGAELIGDDSVEADAELLALVTDCLTRVGLKEFQISIGHVDFIQSMFDAAALHTEDELYVRTLLANRNFFGIDEQLELHHVDERIRNCFRMLPELVGTSDILAKAYDVAPDSKLKESIRRLQQIDRLLKLYGAEDHIIYDLSISGEYGYYTGIVFRAYTYGTGDAIVRGGRYNHLLEKFGRNTPSIGFAVIVDELMIALSRQKIGIQTAERIRLYYTEQEESSAITLTTYFRRKGRSMELVKADSFDNEEELEKKARSSGATACIFLKNPQNYELINFMTGKRKAIDLKPL